MATDKELTAYEFLNLWTTECRKHLRCHWCEDGESKLCPFYYLGCGFADSETIPTPAERSSKFNKDLIKKIKELRDATNTAEKPREDKELNAVSAKASMRLKKPMSHMVILRSSMSTL